MDGIADSTFFSAIKEETRFYIVRHGQSEGNAKRLFQGRLDLPLDDTGRSQARELGDWLAKEGVGAIFSSPLARAAETARIAADACALAEPRIDPLFAEIDTGIFTGLGFEESRELHPEAFLAFEGRSWEAVPGSERADALYDRAMGAWSRLRASALAGERAIACVSHGGFMQWLVRSTFGGRSWMPLISTANCGVFELLVIPRSLGAAYLHWKLLNFQASSTPSALTPISSLSPAANAFHSGSA
jgi:broad specificity phosphatase PhoE